jgi:hypothetical protein
MKTLFLSALVLVTCVACVGPGDAGHYPHGFVAGSRMHYLRPSVARFLYGPPVPIPDPLASGYVVTDSEGHVYISPALLSKQPVKAQR